MKKIYWFIVPMIIVLFQSISLAADGMPENASYCQVGQYDGIPIIWRSIHTDDGILMLSDKILCFKSINIGKHTEYKPINDNFYNENYWGSSTLRKWLNSTETTENVNWNDFELDEKSLCYPYSKESGFLSDDNFSVIEKTVLKTVWQWQALPIENVQSATNGSSVPYFTSYTIRKNYGDTEVIGSMELAELSLGFKGAMNRVQDTVFILNEQQLYNTMNVYGTIGAYTKNVPISDVISFNHCYSYWLSSPANSIERKNSWGFNVVNGDRWYGSADTKAELGVRPAFYLNEDVAQIKSGSGTAEDPYILDGKEQDGITVFINGKQAEFSQTPVIENDRTLVGMRTIFEELGADVEWNGEYKTVTATKDNTTIQLQIDSNIMSVNENSIELDTPARLVNDNTMIPIRAVSEALDATVEWVEDLQRIVIDEQPEWIESDWNPEWYNSALKVGGYME